MDRTLWAGPRSFLPAALPSPSAMCSASPASAEVTGKCSLLCGKSTAPVGLRGGAECTRHCTSGPSRCLAPEFPPHEVVSQEVKRGQHA